MEPLRRSCQRTACRPFAALRCCSSSTRPLLPWVAPLQAKSLEQLQRRRARLQTLLKSLRWPVNTHFVAGGHQYALPCRAGKLQADPVTGKLGLRATDSTGVLYMAGFFDGDGCVTTSATDLSSCTLLITQAYDRCEALLQFHTSFGGGIYSNGRGLGARKPSVHWAIRGARVQSVAFQLARASVLKQAQLSIVAEWPKCNHARQALACTLKELKQHEHNPSSPVSSWFYFTGLFDAEGCIKVSSQSATLRLTLVQKNGHFIKRVWQFLHEQQPGQWTVTTYQSCYTLNCSRQEACRHALQRMLAHGLTVKRKEAELALKLTAANWLTTRDELSLLSGNQSKYRRLDASGATRAARISSLSHWARRPKHDNTQRALELKQLKLEHDIENRAAQIATLKQDIRRLLDIGAQRIV
eukprot:gb/GFBE01011327.1/.p1 GENE.gb/GFBE01011327.1/~~gb/GFBE01011327.1/.p1  ORF type:complete len:413 (+),score=27.60 gb/GFBE01011327.1/:1-1239(+)